jgi:hypothetical protein
MTDDQIMKWMAELNENDQILVTVVMSMDFDLHSIYKAYNAGNRDADSIVEFITEQDSQSPEPPVVEVPKDVQCFYQLKRSDEKCYSTIDNTNTVLCS